VNLRFCEISGYTRSELQNQPHRMLRSDSHPPVFLRRCGGRFWKGKFGVGK
jgi:hypothetical protein